MLAEEVGLSIYFAKKVLGEVRKNGRIIPVEDLREERWHRREKGVGCWILTLTE